MGVAEHVGNTMTFEILTDDTNKVVYRAEVRSALDYNATKLPTFLSKPYKRVLVKLPTLPEFNLTMLIRQTTGIGRVLTPRMNLKKCQSFSLLIRLGEP